MPLLTVSFPPQNRRKNKEKGVDHDGGDGVQRMEPDGTASGIVDRISQQVVCINKHGRNHDHGRIAPAATEERKCDQ